MTNPVSTNSKPLMMTGTEGKANYMVFARKGKIALGVKPNVIANGPVPDTAYVGAKLRSAAAGHLFQDIDGDSNVTKLEHANLTLWDAWPQVTWENRNAERASTQIGVFLKGTLDDTPEVLLDYLKDGKLTRQMADYLVSLAGEDNLIMTVEEIDAWLRGFYEPIVKKIHAKAQLKKEFDSQIGQSIGVFDMQAALLKKVHDKCKDSEDTADTDDDVDIDFGDDGEDDK